MWSSLRRAARLKNVSHVFPSCSGFVDSNLAARSLRSLRDSGYQLLPQVFPFGYLETVHPLVRRFSVESTESFTNSNFNGEFLGQDAADLLADNFDSHDDPSHGDGATKAIKKVDHTKDNIPGSLLSTMDHNGDANLQHRTYRPYLFKIVLDAHSYSVRTVLDKWIEDGNQLERNEALLVLFHLKKQRLYWKALQFMEWMERGKLLSFEERDYVCHLDLIARYSGIEKARKYLERVPKPFRNEVLYETLLVNCVSVSDIKNAEKIFKEIGDLSLALTVAACNQMILLYKRVARHKVADIIMLMEKKNIKPSPFTYKLLIDLKGRSNDISGMESVLNEMKVSGVDPNFATQTMVAKFYISGGLTQKAEAVINEMEVKYMKDKRHAIRSLLHLYAVLNKPDDVARIWKLCTEPNLEDFLAATEAWGKLGCIEQAEETFEAMLESAPNIPSKYYNALLNVYAENKLLAKSKELVERMSLDGCPSGPLTWQALIELYVNSGEVGKANSFLLNVTEQNPDRRPTYGSYICLLMAYAKMGDIHNAEEIFCRLKKTWYPGMKPPYNVLLEAYVNAKAPPHGFRERMRADNVRPIKKVLEQLKFLDKLQR